MSDFPEQPLGTCPECGKLLFLSVHPGNEIITYQGDCNLHGSFYRARSRESFSEYGKTIDSNIGIKGIKPKRPA